MSWAQSRKKSGVLVKKAVGMPGEPEKSFATGTMITNPVCGTDHCVKEKTFWAVSASGSASAESRESQQTIAHAHFAQTVEQTASLEHEKIICGHITATASSTANIFFTYLVSAPFHQLQPRPHQIIPTLNYAIEEFNDRHKIQQRKGRSHPKRAPLLPSQSRVRMFAKKCLDHAQSYR